MLVAVVASSCSSPKETVGPSSDVVNVSKNQPAYTRSVDAISFTSEAGQALDLAFLGGLNVPRPQFIDEDADGDLDLFVQERSEDLMFFRNDGTASVPDYTWETDRYQDLNVGEWYRFYDFDGDGDQDLMAESPYSYVRYWANVGTAGKWEFELVADSLRDVTGQPIFTDRQNIPNITDIDCDQMLDLFIGRLDGTVSRYESVATPVNKAPVFKFVEDRFQDIEIIGEAGMGSIKHGANTLNFEDIDGDGDQDFFWGDFFEEGLLFIENRGTCSSPSLRGDPVQFPKGDPIKTSGYNDPVFADLDNDGDRDLILTVLGGAFNANSTTKSNFYLLRREGDSFEVDTDAYLPIVDVGSESMPVFADLDADGDQDLVLSNKIDPEKGETAKSFIYRNVGSSSNPTFEFDAELALHKAFHKALEFGDLDADGDLDLLVGSWNKDVAYFENVGTAVEPKFELRQESAIKLSRGSNTTPALSDLDGDGDLDAIVGESSGTLNFYRNEGSKTNPNFVLVDDEYLDADVGRRSYPHFVDIDADGDDDLVVGKDFGGIVLFENRGDATTPNFVETSFDGPTDWPRFTTPAFVDIDGDADLDLFVGTFGGGLLFFEKN